MFRCSLTTRESLITDHWLWLRDWLVRGCCDWLESAEWVGWSDTGGALVTLVTRGGWAGDQHTGSIIVVPHTTTSTSVISWYCISSYMHSSSVKVLIETIHNLQYSSHLHILIQCELVCGVLSRPLFLQETLVPSNTTSPHHHVTPLSPDSSTATC